MKFIGFLFIILSSFNCFGFEWSLSVSGFNLFEDTSIQADTHCEEKIKENAEDLRSKYCKNPYKVLCHENPYLKAPQQEKKDLYQKALDHHFKENQELLERLGIFELNETTMAKIESLFSQCHKTTNEIHHVCENKNFLKGVDVMDVYSVSKNEKKEFTKILKEQLKDVYVHYINQEAHKYSQNIKSISEVTKSNLIDTITQQMDALKLNSFELGKRLEIKNELIKKVKSVETLFSISKEALEHLSDEEHDAAIDIYVDVCGKKGDSDNAAAYNVGSKSFILICPMDYLEELKRTPDSVSNELFAKVSSTIIHELSHHFISSIDYDKSVPMENMGDLVQCMSENYMGAEGIHQRPENYIQEVLADHWANLTLSNLFKSKRLEKMSWSDKIKLLQLNVSGLCHTSEDSTHPSGRFRVSQMLYRHQGIFNEMKCYKDATILVTSCTLNGPKVLNLGF